MFQSQYEEHGGYCAVCGDEYEGEDRPHEVPGEFATGILGRSYFEPGQVRSVFGYFSELKLRCQDDLSWLLRTKVLRWEARCVIPSGILGSRDISKVRSKYIAASSFSKF